MSIPASYRPIARPELVALIADRAVRQASAAGRAVVAIDGPVPADATALAGEVARHLCDAGWPVAVVDAGDFLRPRSIRLETGADDPDAGYWRWVDHAALRREVLDPFAAIGRYLPTLWDATRDRATRAQPVDTAPGTVLVLAGSMLLRTELADAIGLGVHLVDAATAIARRLPPGDVDRVTGAWGRYLDWDAPVEAADLVVAFDHPARPALRVG